MTQQQFKVGQKVKVVRGYDEDPELVDGNYSITSGLRTRVTNVWSADGEITHIQIEYPRPGGDAQIGTWYVKPEALKLLRPKQYL